MLNNKFHNFRYALVLLISACAHKPVDQDKIQLQYKLSDYKVIEKEFYVKRSTGKIYYDCLTSKNEFRLKEIEFDKGTVHKNVDLETFKFYGTFCLDKYNIYLLFDQSGERSFVAESRFNYTNVFFFENSYYRLYGDTLKYFGRGNIEEEGLDNNQNIQGKKLDTTDLFVARTSSDYNDIDDFIFYDNSYYRGTIKVIDEINYSNIGLHYFLKHKMIAQKIKVW